MTPFWGWIADAALAVLLVSTLIMAIKLDRALRVVRRDRAVFEALINNLSSATNSVKLGIQALRNEADRAAEQIERRSEDADKLATDLSFLIEAADRAGARLDEARQACPAPARPPEPEIEPPAANHAPVAEATAADPPAHQPGSGVRPATGVTKRRRTDDPRASWLSAHAASELVRSDEAIPSKSRA